MTVVRVSEIGLQDAEQEIAGIGRRARELGPVGRIIRHRWHESERRILAAGAWAPRLASTRRRYRWTVRGRRAGSPGRVTGGMYRALTQPHQAGITDIQIGSSFILGPKVRGQVAHANFFAAGRGGQVARDAVDLDDQGLRDAAEDVGEYLIGSHAGRRR